MLKYLIIQLCDSAPSFCHYSNRKCQNLIDIEVLRKGIKWAMKQNLSVQIVFPSYELPKDYLTFIGQIDHTIITESTTPTLSSENSIYVHSGLTNLPQFGLLKDLNVVIRCKFSEIIHGGHLIASVFPFVRRLNIVMTDFEVINGEDLDGYKNTLNSLSDVILKEYVCGHFVQTNLLTDRFMLDEMNNCNAGIETITFAPDGKFYICPAFYFDSGDYGLGDSCFNVGDLENGLHIPNNRLYDLEHAPLCRICDAYQCKRCVWLNRKTTYEVNTPSHEQCVIAHIERNASRSLLKRIQEKTTLLPNKVIKEINYLDPFDIKPNY